MAEKKIERTVHKKYLKCILTDSEVLTLGKEAAQYQRQMDELELARKAAASDFKSKIDAMQQSVAEHSRLIRDGYEHRYVECEVVEEDWRKLTRTFVRTDTGETFTEKIPASEAQQRLELEARKEA